MKKVILTIVFLSAVCYMLWIQWDRSPPDAHFSAYDISYESFGTERGKGNILGIEPLVHPESFGSKEQFQSTLDLYLRFANSQGLLGKKTIVVFPEYLGTWLALLDEKNSLYKAGSLPEAMGWMIAVHPLEFLFHYWKSDAADPVAESIFRMKSENMKEVYTEVFSGLAKKYEITLVAGSIVLPGSSGKLENQSFIFGPDGGILTKVSKNYPTTEELNFTTASPEGKNKSIPTPLGKFGVLICADSWYPESYKSLENPDLLVVPSFLSPARVWNSEWAGYNGKSAPEGVNPADKQKITEGDAWQKYALFRFGHEGKFRYGMNVFLRGGLWDITTDGRTMIWNNGQEILVPQPSAGAIVNLWL